eukprot:CAMPEP_0176153554 /NCGR_PEP_ID=MMETSP0120_2-20121206/78442_1 /TAXON_ID=160619 /ORGANISM="Kryptoperidinium foliaceum, Strain CCMP 1326" /LENGTH=948 /DNA_ID=CAMNT_0017490617 /DNA_START=174 /DNA_END=3018 /DNA_ORIENTATION=-
MQDEIDSKIAATKNSNGESTSAENDTDKSDPQHILLFYKFHPLSKEEELVELYRVALEKLCRGLQLQGRILVGCNEHQSEGINGTLSGDEEATKAFVRALGGNDDDDDKPVDTSTAYREFVFQFWKDCQEFYKAAKCDPLVMDPSDFKWSTCQESQLFPDLNVKIVTELIGTGGVLAPISLDEVHQGYLTPAEWHERIKELEKDEKAKEETVLIDCRNTKEWQIGHFPGAPDPSTTTFNQFPTWVQQNSQNLANKKVLMYCTGGIRCEKASAFIRNQIPSVQEVRHLKGGIHKYLDEFGSKEECQWKGKNFVFDKRGAHGAAGSSKDEEVVGRCLYCSAPYDVFQPGCVCTVCREPTLVCDSCRPTLREYHCHVHAHLRSCYFTDLTPFSQSELESQLKQLTELKSEIAVGKKFKQRRKTLSRQCEKVAERLREIEQNGESSVEKDAAPTKCRNCGESECSGACWGFHGLKRKRVLEAASSESGSKSQQQASTSDTIDHEDTTSGNERRQKRKAQDKQSAIDELVQLKLHSVPCEGRNEANGIRIPATCTRILQSNTKGKWCGKSLLSVLQTEFAELSDSTMLEKVLKRGLLRVNDAPITSLEVARSTELKNMDVMDACFIGMNHLYTLYVETPVYVCDKPSTVPVHPAGPYLSNSLMMMVEAQEKISPRTLIPCHRIDRVTSGLTLCCTNPKVARLIQSRIEAGIVSKYYLAKVHGRFPSSEVDIQTESTDIAKWNWSDEEKVIEVSAPIETVDPANGIRKITSDGKLALSLFRFVSYDPESNSSIVFCSPQTGRSHQLRVHLQWLGHPIVHDIQYGGQLGENIDTKVGLSEANARRQESSRSSLLHPSSISNLDATSAMEICTFCQEGPEKAFSPAQLLQGGHRICLHAFRYRIPFRRKKDDEFLGELDLRVSPPSWMGGSEGSDCGNDIPSYEELGEINADEKCI